MSALDTDGIRVTVKATYWPERSAPEKNQWAFTYAVSITNAGRLEATLRARHWVITDGDGRIDEVRGDGVVGKQPRLPPGESFEYTSWAMLRTPFGTMRGEYLMERDDGTRFLAPIDEFVLSLPHALN
jgi:ApaG protein